MFNRAEIKQLAKSQLKGKWGGGVLITFIYLVISIATSFWNELIQGLGVTSILIAAPLAIGLYIAFVNFVKGGNKIEVGDLFKGFNIYWKSLGMMLWYILWIFLWMLLLVVPAIIKSIAYSQCFFIIADNPNVKVKDALKISMKMTQGYKWQIFVMGLSFLGWMLLCLLTLGIGFFWLQPYMVTAFTNLFFKLKQLSIEKGVCTEDEFNGIPSGASNASVASI